MRDILYLNNYVKGPTVSKNFNELLTKEQKEIILIQNIQQFAAEGYKLNLSRQISEGNEELLAVIDHDINVIVKAINIYQEELDSLSNP